MAVNLQRCDSTDDDYIDMEISSFSNYFCHSISSPPNNPREFEFQMSVCSLEKDSTTSPADELFYKGKLLPLHLPPRLQMVEKLLQNANPVYESRKDYTFEEFYSTPLTTTVTTPTTTSTPFESCTVSPSESCQVSKELNPEEYFLEYSADLRGFIDENPKKSWTKKLNLIKQSSFGSKLKASKAYLMSFFSRSGCSDESCTSAAKVADEGSVSKINKQPLNKYVKVEKRNPFAQIQHEKRKMPNSVTGSHRRSFSVSIRRQSTKKPSDSSSSLGSSLPSRSNSSSGFHPLQFLKRSTSTNSEIENSIQGAFAHCKQSQQKMRSRKPASEIDFYSLSASGISVSDDQERVQLCRG